MKSILPRAILFDMDDTIIADSASSAPCWQIVCARYASRVEGVTQTQLYDAIQQSSHEYWSNAGRHRQGRLKLECARREVVRCAFLARGLNNIDLANEIADAFSAEREASILLFPGALETLRELRIRGVRLGLITNGNGESQRRKIEKFGLGGFFDCILIEGDIGFGKPDTRVYSLALEKLGILAEETWMVGDNLEWDIQAPQKVGIKAVWVDFAGKGLPPGCCIQPDRIVCSITELVGE